jgi:predicted nucleotidyltransferase component of viral defense system
MVDSGRIQSIKQRLQTLSKEKRIDFNYLLLVYMNEGFLRRLQNSKYNIHLILKGGFLLSSLIESLGRSTRDLDFSAIRTVNNLSDVTAMFKTVCSVVIDDCLTFKTNQLESLTITEDNIYSGIRVTVPCLLGKSRHTLQLDVGFGDRITPGKKEYKLTPLLSEVPISLFVYPIESIVAEKFEAMIALDEINSRMKDFYDLYAIFKNRRIERSLLLKAVRNTFKNRNTVCPTNPVALSAQYYENHDKSRMWMRFLERSATKKDISFTEVYRLIRENLASIYQEIK